MESETQVEVLLAEDSDDDAEMTMDALNDYHLGNRIVRVRDGQETLDYLFCKGAYSGRSNGMPKLVLLDLNMPRVDGLEVLRQVRDDPTTVSVPIVLLTSSAEERDLHRAYQLHVNSYIVKPVDFDQFVAAVREVGLYWLVLNRPTQPARSPASSPDVQ